QLRSVLNAATQVAIIATDLRGVINTFNAGAEQMLGFKSEAVVGRLTLESLHLALELESRAASLSVALGKRIAPSQAMLVESPDNLHEAQEWT
ncbi:PAS domain-containing protein, partial [Enterococcus faecalis]|uniref:PAS domain-containing protein n=4 Tax=Bacteria TaxID=2 RepID=UPI003CC6D394